MNPYVLLFALGLTSCALPWVMPLPKNPNKSSARWTDIKKLRFYLPGKTPPFPLEALLIEVCSRLEVGNSSREAWLASLSRHGIEVKQLPPSHDPHLSGQHLQHLLTRQLNSDQLSSLRGICAAIDFSAQVGAPLDQVLRHCANSISDSTAAARARRISFSAPKTSAKLLSGLPLIGLALGTTVGTNPIDPVFDGSLGTISSLTGLLFLLGGMWWMKKLTKQAEAQST